MGRPRRSRRSGRRVAGKLVYNVDQFRYGGLLARPGPQRSAQPVHDWQEAARLAQAGGDGGAAGRGWVFKKDAPLAPRPTGGKIQVRYQVNQINYAYDRKTNTYLRSVSRGDRQIDAATGKRVAPKNVVVMFMQFGPLNDGDPPIKRRLEAEIIGKGKAWMATNGRTTAGTLVKKTIDRPTRFFDAAGHQVTLTVGQTFVQVMPVGRPVRDRGREGAARRPGRGQACLAEARLL